MLWQYVGVLTNLMMQTHVLLLTKLVVHGHAGCSALERLSGELQAQRAPPTAPSDFAALCCFFGSILAALTTLMLECTSRPLIGMVMQDAVHLSVKQLSGVLQARRTLQAGLRSIAEQMAQAAQAPFTLAADGSEVTLAEHHLR